MCLMNLLDIFRKDKKLKIELINVNNPLTDYIKKNIGKFQVICSPSRKFIWFKNAKVAGTSMYRGVMRPEVVDLISYKQNPTMFNEWWDNLTDRELENYFKFTFVRNPFDRLVSAFSHIIVEGTINDYHKNIQLIEVGIPTDRIVNETGHLEVTFDHVYLMFGLFIKRLIQHYDINDDSVHWMPQHIFTECDGTSIVDFIGKYENLDEDWRYVAEKINVNTKLPFISSSRTQKITNKTRYEMQKVHWKGYYFSNDIISTVIHQYQKDFDLLGYRPIALSLQQRIQIRKEMLNASGHDSIK